MEKEIKQALTKAREEMNAEPQPDASVEEAMKRLADHIDGLITTDFNRLLSVLYRMDIGEEVLKATLAGLNPTETAGRAIARLIIRRLHQKLITRRQYSQQYHDEHP